MSLACWARDTMRCQSAWTGSVRVFTSMMPAVYHASTAAGANDPTEYFLTCLHLLVNVGLALRDLVGCFRG